VKKGGYEKDSKKRLENFQNLEKSMEIDDSIRFKYDLKSFVVDKQQHN